jgi:membrane protein implicated in regulation of membrane protease activity
MINLCAMWTPGPFELIIIMFVVLFVLTLLVLIRWIFRINKRTELLSQIRDELKKLNMKG